ncbi:MAG TPA: hypothetical protein VG321_05370 [Solirubrobacteraceae bacterium]|jgi:hypothetical protein|nr:hypothetical protein [Solirubrobacteraceae bacterium]
MRYVVIDLEGNQRESFESVEELLSELRDIVLSAGPATLAELYVLEHDDAGHEAGPTRRADEILAGAFAGVGTPQTYLFDFVNGHASEIVSPDSDPEYREIREQIREQTVVPA